MIASDVGEKPFIVFRHEQIADDLTMIKLIGLQHCKYRFESNHL